MAASFSAVREEMTAVRNGTLREVRGRDSVDGCWYVRVCDRGGGGGVICLSWLMLWPTNPESRSWMGSGW